MVNAGLPLIASNFGLNWQDRRFKNPKILKLGKLLQELKMTIVDFASLHKCSKFEEENLLASRLAKKEIKKLFFSMHVLD